MIIDFINKNKIISIHILFFYRTELPAAAAHNARDRGHRVAGSSMGCGGVGEAAQGPVKGKRKRGGGPGYPAPELDKEEPKRSRVHAQRKFAQGAGGVSPQVSCPAFSLGLTIPAGVPAEGGAGEGEAGPGHRQLQQLLLLRAVLRRQAGRAP